MQLSRLLHEQASNHIGSIKGEIQSPPMLQAMLGMIMYALFIGGFCVLLLLPLLMHFIPAPAPVVLQTIQGWVSRNQSVLLVSLFVCSWLSSSLTQTGAFEVFYDQELIWSKLQSGQLPTIDYLVKQLQVQNT